MERVEAEAAAALPTHRLADAALFAVDHLLQAWNAVGARVISDLDADITPLHLVRDRRRRARAEKGVEHQIAGSGGDRQNSLDQPLRLGRDEIGIAEQC